MIQTILSQAAAQAQAIAAAINRAPKGDQQGRLFYAPGFPLIDFIN